MVSIKLGTGLSFLNLVALVGPMLAAAIWFVFVFDRSNQLVERVEEASRNVEVFYRIVSNKQLHPDKIISGSFTEKAMRTVDRRPRLKAVFKGFDANEVEPFQRSLKSYLSKKELFSSLRITVIDPHNKVLASNFYPTGVELNHKLLEEKEKILLRIYPSWVHEFISREAYYHAQVPVYRNGSLQGKIIIDSWGGLNKGLQTSTNQLLISIVLFLIYGLIISRLISRIIMTPIKGAIEYSQNLANNPEEKLVPAGMPIAELNSLNDSVSFLAKSLNKKNKYLYSFSRQVSHELKTPLTSILGNVENLIEYESSISKEERSRFLKNSYQDVKKMNRIVSQLLQLARIDILEPTAENSEIEGIAKRIGDSFLSAGIQYQLDLQVPQIPMPSSSVEIILENLWENSVNHGSATAVELSSRIEDNKILIIYKDNGSGIKEGDKERIFDEFYSTAKDSGGTGLGLSIVRSLVERFGGEVVIPQTQGGFTILIKLSGI